MFAQQVQVSFEARGIVYSRYEYLDDAGFRFPGRFAERGRVHGDFPDMREGESRSLRFLPDYIQISLGGIGLWQQYQTGSVPTPLREGYTLKQDELVGNLNHDTCAVPTLVIRAFSPTVLHVCKHREGLFDEAVSLVTVQVYEHADATGIMLELTVV